MNRTEAIVRTALVLAGRGHLTAQEQERITRAQSRGPTSLQLHQALSALREIGFVRDDPDTGVVHWTGPAPTPRAPDPTTAPADPPPREPPPATGGMFP